MRTGRLALLIGAGASYGAFEEEDLRPPLGYELYASLRARCPDTWGQLTLAQQQAFNEDQARRSDFEAGMERLWEMELRPDPNDPQTPFFSPPPGTFGEPVVQDLLSDMACFFSMFETSPAIDDCYTVLARCLRDSGLIASSRVVAASLNYELLFDMAAANVGIVTRAVGQASDAFSIWKPHGACNLVPDAVLNGSLSGVLAGGNRKGIMGGTFPVTVVQPATVRDLYSRQRNVPPAMSLYAPGKKTPVARHYIDRARREWNSWALSADVIAVIGVRFVPGDDHVWAGVLGGDAQIWYLGDKYSSDQLCRAVGPDRLTHIGDRFRPSLDDLVSRINTFARSPAVKGLTVRLPRP